MALALRTPKLRGLAVSTVSTPGCPSILKDYTLLHARTRHLMVTSLLSRYSEVSSMRTSITTIQCLLQPC
ncbi:hypothetical protein HBI24_138110 [Parastagonospora nodorum]|nr:hypothetical protein HBH47_113480 [Parastagonospora nodorum]KAH4169274.1 hypothetical protein HBH43_115160 [Parastagonospora nodorum]KAH5057676.1 hypothetical protein HBH96_108490 [Parastagonospora nodorum]KAH5282349.1 hypothetical protein HBI71_007850 [Parastagonospora nodorum]KAH5580687.1 hypothetical protein HBI24_138110 [Parastagonospora nodorum]